MSSRWGRIATFALGAAAFFFMVELVVLKGTVDSALRWATGMALLGGLLAWQQLKR